MEDFVTFEIAKKLKEKGFLEECFATYSLYGGIFKLNEIDADKIASYNLNILDKCFKKCYNYYIKGSYCDAPTISQVMKWLREKKKIYINIDVNYIVCKYEESIYKYRFYITNLSNHDRDATLEDFDSFEECALAGINYALDYLI